jgi:putative membrane protein
MRRRLTLLAGVAVIAAQPALAQTEQQRAQAAQGQTPGQSGSPTQAPGPAPAATASRAESVTGQEFMRLAAMSDRFEIATSRLAQQKSQNAAVKQFAETMIRDHEKTTAELQQMSAAAGGMPQNQARTGGQVARTAGPGPQDGLDQQHAALLQQLEQASGAGFDRLYARQQAMAHQQAVDMFRNYAQQGDTPALRQWASGTLPALEHHLQMAQQLQQSMPG